MTNPLPSLVEALRDRYRIERELGQGGMATVYLAEDLRHKRKVAIKVLRPELAAVIGAERFLAEITTTANLQHPHILPLHDSGAVDGTVYYVMPFVDGESLRDRLDREKQLPVADAVRIASEVADALGYAHGHGIIHRDIKPDNILLHGGHALVADFGIALAVSKSEGSSRMTETGMSLGTPHYMSPEQALGERNLDARADIYAVGCVLYEMLAGEPPFTGPTAQSIIAKVMSAEPSPITSLRKSVPDHVAGAIRVAIQKLPADRFATAAEFLEALSRPGTHSALAPSATAIPATPRQRARHLAPWVVAGVALVLAAWGWLGRPPVPGTSWQYIGLGDRQFLGVRGAGLALSPDGTLLVFASDSISGPLWLKRRDALTPTPIPGTEGANNPAFSADGGWIAYTVSDKLKKVQVAGGASITLADSADVSFGGVAWLDDGTIVYVGSDLTTLLRVPETGGASTVVLRDPSLAGLGLGGPVALPDARGVLFTVCNSGCSTTAVSVLDLRSGEFRQLVPDASRAWYLADGVMIYLRLDGVAMAVRLDLDRLVLVGEPTPVLEKVNAVFGLPQLAVSASGTLAYLEGTGLANEFELVRVSREGVAVPIDSSWHGGFNSFDLSPDGRRLLVGVGLANGQLGIWVKQLDAGPFTRLTFSGQDRRPAVSPDGRRVAFVRDTGLSGGLVFERAVDGGTPDRMLARLDRPVQEVAWSPDGAWLLLRTDNGGVGLGDIMGIRTTGDTTPVPLVASPFEELQPTVSPDGRWLAYMSNESGGREVYVRRFPATDGGRWQVSIGGGSGPRWSADGRELYYYSGFDLVAAAVAGGSTFEITGRQVLFNTAPYYFDLYHQSYDVQPNGGFVFMRQHAGGQPGAGPRMVLVENWLTDLRVRMAR